MNLHSTTMHSDAQIASSIAKKIKDIAYLEGEFTTRAGKKTNYYIDKYKFETDPETLNAVTDALCALFPAPETYDRIAAPELGAVPLASVLSIKLKKPFFIVRKENKGYGTKNLIEGPYKQGERIVLVEDVLTTAGAAIQAGNVVESEGMTIVKLIGVINREEGAAENIQAKGWSWEALVTTRDLKAC